MSSRTKTNVILGAIAATTVFFGLAISGIFMASPIASAQEDDAEKSERKRHKYGAYDEERDRSHKHGAFKHKAAMFAKMSAIAGVSMVEDVSVTGVSVASDSSVTATLRHTGEEVPAVQVFVKAGMLSGSTTLEEWSDGTVSIHLEGEGSAYDAKRIMVFVTLPTDS